MPLKEYFMKIQQRVDALASVGKPISQDDHFFYICSDSPSIQDVTSLLLTQETSNENKIIFIY